MQAVGLAETEDVRDVIDGRWREATQEQRVALCSTVIRLVEYNRVPLTIERLLEE